MQIHHLRSATLIIHAGDQRILVDPMLGAAGTLPAYAKKRHLEQRNPIVELPDSAAPALEHVTAALITHLHGDHLDEAGTQFLVERKLPVYCAAWDMEKLQEHDLDLHPLQPEHGHPFFDGEILVVPTQHGYGRVGKLMGQGVGYVIDWWGEPALYISGDTVLTPRVRQALTEHQPDIAILAAGSASLDVGDPILMTLPEMLEFIELAPGKVIANHLEVLNHCPTTRDQLRDAVRERGLQDKVIIPDDGELLTI